MNLVRTFPIIYSNTRYSPLPRKNLPRRTDFFLVAQRRITLNHILRVYLTP